MDIQMKKKGNFVKG